MLTLELLEAKSPSLLFLKNFVKFNLTFILEKKILIALHQLVIYMEYDNFTHYWSSIV